MSQGRAGRSCAGPLRDAGILRPLRADARRNRAKVLEAAEEVFASEGLAVPIDEVARRAGVGVGTVYRHFPTKEALFEAIVVARLEALVERAEELGTSRRSRDSHVHVHLRAGRHGRQKEGPDR